MTIHVDAGRFRRDLRYQCRILFFDELQFTPARYDLGVQS
jgi:hypothetical protein